jgi:virulence-associated protein VagC
MPATALTAAEKSAVYLTSASADAPADAGRHVRLFRNGANQAVRIPREFEFDAKEVIMKKVGNTLVLEPVAAWPQRGSACARPSLPCISVARRASERRSASSRSAW